MVIAITLTGFPLAAVAGQVSLPATGDAAAGEQVYARCIGCHSFERNRTGPMHCGLFGRAAASVPGYAYSKEMAASGIIWDESSLDSFLQAPLDRVPGTLMGFAGIKNLQDRQNLIAYLRQQSSSDRCR